MPKPVEPEAAESTTEVNTAKSETAADNTEALAKAAQNPIANMISLPVQNNTNFGIGPHNRTQNIANIQPVIPFELSEDWIVINRVIAPLVYQPFVGETSGGMFGLGDISYNAFFSPSDSGGITWGVGPIISFPSATDSILGSGKWSAGPSAIVLAMQGKWVYGALINNIWDFAGSSSRNHVNQMLIQPFINYNLPNGWYLSSVPIITANWKAESSERWIVPLGGGVGKVLNIGDQPINCSVQAYSNVVKPDGGPDWQLRLQVQLLFPK